MFRSSIYRQRRQVLKDKVQTGCIVFTGNRRSPINYAGNTYPFRQDSSFLYYFGLDMPDLAALIDVDGDADIIFGDDPTMDDIIWEGPSPTLGQWCEKTGISANSGSAGLQRTLEEALTADRPIHFLPQYQAGNAMKLAQMLNLPVAELAEKASPELLSAVIDQRSIKTEPEIEQIEAALDISFIMHTTAMRMSSPGQYEREIAGAVSSIAFAASGRMPAFPIIFSIDGQTLHNHSHANLMQEGDMIVHDSGAESPLGYASDITRTIPVSGEFTPLQKDIYTMVLRMQAAAFAAMKPGIAYRDVHLTACRQLAADLVDLDLYTGDVEAIVESGAHALLFPHGLGHMLGLDVHDMEGLGEDLVGYDRRIRRSPQFGISYLRLGKVLESGFVVTVEPGIYFIPKLIERWKAEKKFEEYINYDHITDLMDFGGIRLEDDILVTESGIRVLGPPIPRTIDEVEACCGELIRS
ncbi:MAG: aminopeptidase P family protein [Desulfobacteraceae bacterium]|nr:aminopeptidase P family protein [Desulfobacteraceae bacterium]